MSEGRPVIGASACVWRAGHVLLARRGKSPNLDLWSLPGGHVELGEAPVEAAARELMEETGTVADLRHLVDCLNFVSRDASGIVRRHYVVAVYTGHWREGEARPGDDAVEVAWMEPDAVGRVNATEGLQEVITRAALLIR